MKKTILQLKKGTIATLQNEEIVNIYGGQENDQEYYVTEGKCFTQSPICVNSTGCPTTTGHSPCINNC